MTRIITWNIQNGKGVDEVVSLARIARLIRELGDADVICLQEVSRHLALFGGKESPDQVAELASLFPDYRIVFGAGVDAAGDAGTGSGDRRWQFGNATLSRLPIRSTFRHLLPRPPAPGKRHMQRQATEITIQSDIGPLRIVNSHLEYHVTSQRLAQVRRLGQLHAEAIENSAPGEKFDAAGPYQCALRARSAVFCGDFNMAIGSPEYEAMVAPLDNGEFQLEDAWRQRYSNTPHAPTCGIHDHVQWPEGPHTRDFFFVSGDLAPRVKAITVDTITNASDHQPLMLEL